MLRILHQALGLLILARAYLTHTPKKCRENCVLRLPATGSSTRYTAG